jgi:hypothetical protein
VVSYAALIQVDNSSEDPDEGREGLRGELLPFLQTLAGFDEAVLLTAYERGRGVALIVFDTEEQASALTSGLALGQSLRQGVSITGIETFEVTARG